jgi:hypothetical protein
VVRSAGIQTAQRGGAGAHYLWAGALFCHFLQWIYAKTAGLTLAALFGRDTAPFFQTLLEWSWNERVGFSLAVTYLVWIAGAILLYIPCRWFAEVKARRREWWFSYV